MVEQQRFTSKPRQTATWKWSIYFPRWRRSQVQLQTINELINEVSAHFRLNQIKVLKTTNLVTAVYNPFFSFGERSRKQ